MGGEVESNDKDVYGKISNMLKYGKAKNHTVSFRTQKDAKITQKKENYPS